MRSRPLLSFIALHLFERSRAGILSDEDVRKVENELQEDPYAGKLVAGTGGVRKIRVGRESGGKRGGARVLYYFLAPRSTVYLMLAYAKNDQSDLDAAQKRLLRSLAESIEEED